MIINNSDVFVENIPGNGDLNCVLVHNAGGNHHFFTHQLNVLKKYGNVILIDLPGHGQSQVMPDLNMNCLSDCINQICIQLSLTNICLIGLNNGANLVINTALTCTLPIKQLILIDPPVFMNQSFIAEIRNFIECLNAVDFDKFVFSLVDSLFIETTAKNKDIAIESFNTVDKKSLSATFQSLIDWDTHCSEMVKMINYPTLCILTDEHHCCYEKMRHEAPQFEIGKVIGSKCWATLEVPEQINAMMERFIRMHS